MMPGLLPYRFHIPALLPLPRHRRLLSICIRPKGSKLKKMVKLMSSVCAGKDTGSEAIDGGEETLIVHDNGPQGRSINGSVVALGKFDALHIGHRALAIQASKMGAPVLLSFAGMAEVLQWEKRLPIVAPCDRKRVMSLWAALCGGKAPEEYQLEFAKVRSLSPHDFVEKLARELHVKGVVAGSNYRFGYKASGDASDLAQLCGRFGLEIFIVDPVMDAREEEVRDVEATAASSSSSSNSREKGQVSSTRVRKALSEGKMRRVSELLGREHRLVFSTDDCAFGEDTIRVPISKALNQVPGDGIYCSKMSLSLDGIHETRFVGSTNVTIAVGDEHVVVDGRFDRRDWCSSNRQAFLCLDLQCKSSSSSPVLESA